MGELMSRMQIAIVTGNRLLRESLERFLSRKLAAEIYSADHLVSSKNGSSAHSVSRILLVDAQTTDPSTLESVRNALCGHAGRQVILFGMPRDRRLFVETLLWGVTGYVLDDAGAWGVLEAVRMVSTGQLVCPPELCRLLFPQTVEGPTLHEHPAPQMTANAR
jgi:DNA-binding NarL/FixJ family response regulator